MNLDPLFLEEELKKAKYVPELGLKETDLGKTTIGNVLVSSILIELDPGKQLRPHLHETEGGEIWLPITKGLVQLGKAQKDELGNYKVNNEQNIIADWEKPTQLTPFKAIEVAQGTPHFLSATNDNPLILICFLPTSHPTTDIKYVTHP